MNGLSKNILTVNYCLWHENIKYYIGNNIKSKNVVFLKSLSIFMPRIFFYSFNWMKGHFRQLMRLWYLSHRRPAKAQASLGICAVTPEPSLFAHMKYGRRRRVRPKIRHLAPLDGCACTFEEWVYGGRKVPKSHDMVHLSLQKCLVYFLLLSFFRNFSI